MKKPTANEIAMVPYWINEDKTRCIPDAVLVEFPLLLKAITDLQQAENLLTIIGDHVSEKQEDYEYE